jgi:hypothetical protein
MMTIGSVQFARLAAAHRANFIQRLVQKLKATSPQWCDGKTDAGLSAFAGQMTDFAEAHGLYAEASISALMQLRIETGFKLELSEFQHMVLGREGFSESYRVTQFRQTLSGNRQPVLITLATDVAAVRASNGR